MAIDIHDILSGLSNSINIVRYIRDLWKPPKHTNPIEDNTQSLKRKDHLNPIEGLPGLYMQVFPHLIMHFNSALGDISEEEFSSKEINLLYWIIDNVVRDKNGNKVEDINSPEDIKNLGVRECSIIVRSAHKFLGKWNYKPNAKVQLHAWLITKGISPDQIDAIPADVYNYLYLRYKHSTIGFDAEARNRYRILTYIKSTVLATQGINNYDKILDLLPEEEPFLTFHEDTIGSKDEAK